MQNGISVFFSSYFATLEERDSYHIIDINCDINFHQNIQPRPCPCDVVLTLIRRPVPAGWLIFFTEYKPDFSGKFSFAQIWAKRAQKWTFFTFSQNSLISFFRYCARS